MNGCLVVNLRACGVTPVLNCAAVSTAHPVHCVLHPLLVAETATKAPHLDISRDMLHLFISTCWADHALCAYCHAVPCRFGLAFGESVNGEYGIFGNPTKYGLLHNVGAEPNADLAATIPLSLFCVFQMAFAIITPSLLIGSVADR